jgi:UDP-N-acetylmuramoylalanine--D-glutamate ligase
VSKSLPGDLHVLELQFLSLTHCRLQAAHIAIITNISPDHLDRYDYKYENYIVSKFRITMNQTEDLIYDADDSLIANWLKE